MLESIQSIIPSWQMSKIKCIFFYSFVFLILEEHFSKQNVLQLTKEEENISKSQYRYRSIIK